MLRKVFSIVGLLSCGLTHAQDLGVTFAEPVTMAGYAGGIAVEWRVLDDRAVDYYAILRRVAGLERVVGTIEPQRSVANEPVSYRYIDASPFENTLAFRLRVVFGDGTYADGDWLSANRAHGTRSRVLSALDQESLARLHLSLESQNDHGVVVRINTLQGRLYDSYAQAVVEGINVLEIDYANWPAGYYTVQIEDSTEDGDEVSEWLLHVDARIPKASTRRIVAPR